MGATDQQQDEGSQCSGVSSMATGDVDAADDDEKAKKNLDH